jgi:hypothetical protein
LRAAGFPGATLTYLLMKTGKGKQRLQSFMTGRMASG